MRSGLKAGETAELIVLDHRRETHVHHQEAHLTPHILRGVGATLALPFLDAMVPAQTPLARTAAAPTQRFGFVYVPHGSIMKDWTPAQDGHGVRVLADPEADGTVPQPAERVHRPDQQRRERALAEHGDVAERHVPAKGSVIHLSTTVDQIIAAQNRPGDDVPVDGVRHRGSLEPSRQLRRRLPVLVHEHDLLADADAAAADGNQPARRVRADVRRRRRHARGAPRAPRARTPASSTRSATACATCSEASAPGSRASSMSTSRTFAKSSGASSRPRTSAPSTCSMRRRRRSACPNRGKSTSS